MAACRRSGVAAVSSHPVSAISSGSKSGCRASAASTRAKSHEHNYTRGLHDSHSVAAREPAVPAHMLGATSLHTLQPSVHSLPTSRPLLEDSAVHPHRWVPAASHAARVPKAIRAAWAQFGTSLVHRHRHSPSPQHVRPCGVHAASFSTFSTCGRLSRRLGRTALVC